MPESKKVVTLINKNGLAIHNAAKPVYEELIRGTGCVMADKSSIFIENEGIGQKYIVVSRVPESNNPGWAKKFPASNFKDAWDFFIGG